MIIRAFITHKFAELFADCQDRFGVSKDTKSIAVSDGMGATWQQKIWAQLLVDTYTDSTDWCPSKETIKPLCQTWRAKVVDFIQNLKDTSAPNNRIYRNERNLAEGRSAGATFVGIRFNGNEWIGSVLGDSCLIEWNGVEAKFHTSQEVDSFDSYPDYFDSDETKEGKGTPKAINGQLDTDSYLFLVSDPFSDFLFEHNKQGDIADYIKKLLDIYSHDDFETLVEDWRKAGMHNDDTTLVIVENDGSDNFSTIEIDDINVLIDKEIELRENNQEVIIETAENVEVKTEIEIETGEEENDPIDNTGQVDKAESSIPIKKQGTPQVIVDSDDFVKSFSDEYRNSLSSRKKSKLWKGWNKLRFDWTYEAAEEALHKLLEKYSIICK